VGRRKEAGEELVKSLGDNALFFQTNLEDYQSQVAMYKGVYKAWGRIDALCANAGIVDKSSVYILNWRNKDADEVPPEPDMSCTDINYKGVVYGTVLATHLMRHNKPNPGGKIVITGSIGGLFPHRGFPEYCGTKGAVITFTRTMAPMLKQKDNIVINCILPGVVNTPIIPPEMVAAVSPEWYVSTAPFVRHRTVATTDISSQVLLQLRWS
jgi:NAD(P)-dependent dehydrogenase (short-subunit alcohol dehydrogenase family)